MRIQILILGFKGLMVQIELYYNKSDSVLPIKSTVGYKVKGKVFESIKEGRVQAV